ncbi:MAG: thioredoxin domain-containing protein [Nitrososphaerota archaeon]
MISPSYINMGRIFMLQVMDIKEKKPNRLINEKSPYLLQHAYNPVDWYPWCDEAFEKAMKEDKPIFLSIGYSACHWCHRMEEECFQDTEVAELMNKVFVNIKVDREERPDIDNYYMSVSQMMTGTGGWPLTIIMTPNRKPFFAATYIPKVSTMGMRGIIELINQVEELWKEKRRQVVSQAERTVELLSRNLQLKSDVKGPYDRYVQDAYADLLATFDDQHGGFGDSPKFPMPAYILFLLTYWKVKKDKAALVMVERTLKKMREGGIFDQLGYGFHRYSTDARWMIPHFEKMLYDQALMIIAYTDAYKATGNQEFALVAREIAEYVFRDMRNEEGAFYSSEDADSEGEEGKFYLWTESEIKEILGDDMAKVAIHYYMAAEKVLISHERYILHRKMKAEELAKELGASEDDIARMIESARALLLKARNRRVRPAKDTKVLADWNAIMIVALARASSMLGDDIYLKRAIDCYNFINKRMTFDGKLFHRYADNEAAIPGFLDDYAYMIWACIELYEATFNPSYMHAALELNKLATQHFWDEKEGGYFQSSDELKGGVKRLKETHDGAIPSGNSVMALNLWRLYKITAKEELRVQFEQLLSFLLPYAAASPTGHTFFMNVLILYASEFYEIAIVGDIYDDSTRKIVEALRALYLPNSVIVLKKDGLPSDFVSKLDKKDDRTTVYVCKNHSCESPTNDVDVMLSLIR